MTTLVWVCRQQGCPLILTADDADLDGLVSRQGWLWRGEAGNGDGRSHQRKQAGAPRDFPVFSEIFYGFCHVLAPVGSVNSEKRNVLFRPGYSRMHTD